MIEKLLSLVRPLRLDWIQLEVTSRCTAECSYCPRTVYRDAWLDRDLSAETFERLRPALPRAGLVYFQGWGEPFLHPELPAWMAVAKEAGCKVGTTTNGMLLDAATLGRVVDAGVDVLAFSLAGADERNDGVRRGTRLADVLGHIRTLDAIKRERGRDTPRIHVAYMLLRSGLADVGRLPETLADTGVCDVVISTLDFVPDEALSAEAIRPASDAEYASLRERLDEVQADGERRGLRVHYRLARPGRRGACTENVGRSMFVSADGSVSGCVFGNLPVGQPVTMYRDGPRRYERAVLGNVNRAAPGAIWHARDARALRSAVGRTGARQNDPARRGVTRLCAGCPKLHLE